MQQSKEDAQITADIDQWAMQRLTKWCLDYEDRMDMIGAEHRSYKIITTLLGLAAVGLVAHGISEKAACTIFAELMKVANQDEGLQALAAGWRK